MKCPKCGYHSFDHLDNCKKCSHDLSEHKTKFSLRGFFSPGKKTAAAPVLVPEENDEEEEQADDVVDFGFDFLDEEEAPVAPKKGVTSLGSGAKAIDINQPFAADGQSIPADSPDDSDDKPGKGPEFAF